MTLLYYYFIKKNLRACLLFVSLLFPLGDQIEVTEVGYK